MKKRKLALIMSAMMAVGMLNACGSSAATESAASSSAEADASSAAEEEEVTDSIEEESAETVEAEHIEKNSEAYAAALKAAEENGTIYQSLNTGRWDELQIDEFEGNYSVYVPEGYEYCSPAVLILTPDQVSAKDWLDGEEGQSWINTADTNKIALVVAEPNGSWNVAEDEAARDDEEYLHKIYGKLTSKNATQNDAAFDLNERALYLVGYNEGATAANKMAMMWPAIFAGMVSIDGDNVDAAVAESLGSEISYPFAEATEEGRDENNIPNNEIPVRVWMISSADKDQSENIAYWTAANDLTAAAESSNALATVLTAEEDGQELPEQVWYTNEAAAVDSETIYTEFLEDVQRFVGDPGGYLEWTVEHTNDGTHGFFLSEEKIDGLTRRWYTYVPESYDGSAEVPLVVAIHGYSSAITAFTGDSRWQNVADDYGFIVAFAQAYVNDAAYSTENGSCIPVPAWNNYSLIYSNVSKEEVDDVSFIKQLVDITKENYSIDNTRVYATGHSNGSAMTWMLAQDAPEYFTAMAPIGFNWGSYPGYALGEDAVDYSGCEENTYVLPVWCMTGSYDVGEKIDYSEGTKNGNTVAYWKAYNGTADEGVITEEVRATRAEHTYTTTSYVGQNEAPLVRYTAISNNCHSYMEDIAYMVWEEFFVDYTRDENGTLYYKGEVVEKVSAE